MQTRLKVAVAELAQLAGRDLSIEQEILGPQAELARVSFNDDPSALVAACADAEVILTDFVPFTAEVLLQLPACRLISVAATGYNSIDVEAAAALGIRVCAVEEYCTSEVADHTLMLLLALARRFPAYHAHVQRDGGWQFDLEHGLRRLSSLTLGIVGFGRIGQAVAARAAGFGMRILAFDPVMESSPDSLASLVSLETLYDESDIISLHCSLTLENRGFVDAGAFAQMRKQPFLINVARGELINETDLCAALDSGQVAGAALDVLTDEAPDVKSHPLVGRENVILTPHMAFYSDASIRECREVSARNIRCFVEERHGEVRRYV